MTVVYRNIYSRATFVLVGDEDVQARINKGGAWVEESRR